MTKTKPNAPCPCGSKKKFKRCCKSSTRTAQNQTMTRTMSADSTRRPLTKALKIKNPNPDVLRFIEAEALSKTRMDLARSNQITACCACLVRQV